LPVIFIIEFGHNDEKKKDPKRYTEPFGGFKQNLELFIRESREHEATPVLATPVARRKFDVNGGLVGTPGDYVKAVREVAQQQRALLLEMNTRSVELLASLARNFPRNFSIGLARANLSATRRGCPTTHISMPVARAGCATLPSGKSNQTFPNLRSG
jgi:lysophospholipase L1-like esterase